RRAVGRGRRSSRRAWPCILGDQAGAPVGQVIGQRPGLVLREPLRGRVDQPLPAEKNPVLDVPRQPLRHGLVGTAGLAAAITVLIGVFDDVLIPARWLVNSGHLTPPSPGAAAGSRSPGPGSPAPCRRTRTRDPPVVPV